QACVTPRMPDALLPVRMESLGDLGDLRGIVNDHAVIPRLGEILLTKVEGGNEGDGAVHHDRLLMRNHEMRTGPFDRHTSFLKEFECLVVCAAARGSLRIEHYPHIDTRLGALDHGLLDLRLSK